MEARGKEIIPAHNKQIQVPEVIIPAAGAIMEITEMAVDVAIHALEIVVTRVPAEHVEASAPAIVLIRIRPDAARPIVAEDAIQIVAINVLMGAPVAIQHVAVVVMLILHAMVVTVLAVVVRAVILQMEVQTVDKLGALIAVANAH